MIFITLGSQKFQFDRLLRAVDELVENGQLTDEVFAQTGYSDYQPRNYKYSQFLDREAFLELQKKADLIITHGGTGAIINAVKNGKKVIAVPRLSKYGEHVDDHQMQIVKEFEDLGYISACYEIEQLANVFQIIISRDFNKYVSNTDNYIEAIENYIDNN